MLFPLLIKGPSGFAPDPSPGSRCRQPWIVLSEQMWKPVLSCQLLTHEPAVPLAKQPGEQFWWILLLGSRVCPWIFFLEVYSFSIILTVSACLFLFPCLFNVVGQRHISFGSDILPGHVIIFCCLKPAFKVVCGILCSYDHNLWHFFSGNQHALQFSGRKAHCGQWVCLMTVDSLNPCGDLLKDCCKEMS